MTTRQDVYRMADENPQKVNVLNMLLNGPVCGLERNPYIGARLAARVLDLRDTKFAILTEGCAQDHGHRRKQIQYRLTYPGEAVNRCPFCGKRYMIEWVADRNIDTEIVRCASCEKRWVR